MLQFDCFPVSDRLQIFRHLLTDLWKFRLEAKAKMRAAKNPAEQRHLEAFQNTFKDRKSTRLNSSHRCISYAVFCLKKKIIQQQEAVPGATVDEKRDSASDALRSPHHTLDVRESHRCDHSIDPSDSTHDQIPLTCRA